MDVERNGKVERHNVDGVFIFVGFKPVGRHLFKDHIAHDENDYLITDQFMQTSIPGVYAAGDTRAQLAKQVTTAVGDATTAVLHAERYIEDLKHVERAMPKAEGRTVAEATRSLRTVRFAPGQRVVKQGDIGDEFYIVVRGALDIVHQDDAGEVNIIRTIGEGDSFGEIALLADVPRTATVIARTDSEVLVMDRAIFRRIVASNPEAVEDIYSRAAERLKELRG